jgi:hypothetical protein
MTNCVPFCLPRPPDTMRQWNTNRSNARLHRGRERGGGDREGRRSLRPPRFDFDSPAIHQAKKNLALVDVLLQHGADINAFQMVGGWLRHIAWDLTPEQAAPLISCCARITPWAAAGLELYDELKSILRPHPHLVHERGGVRKTALHCAALCRHMRHRGAGSRQWIGYGGS